MVCENLLLGGSQWLGNLVHLNRAVTIEFGTPMGDLDVHLEGCMFLCSIGFHAWNQHRQQLMPLFRDQYPGRNLLDRKLPKLTRID